MMLRCNLSCALKSRFPAMWYEATSRWPTNKKRLPPDTDTDNSVYSVVNKARQCWNRPFPSNQHTYANLNIFKNTSTSMLPLLYTSQEIMHAAKQAERSPCEDSLRSPVRHSQKNIIPYAISIQDPSLHCIRTPFPFNFPTHCSSKDFLLSMRAHTTVLDLYLNVP